jgi:hypothetical protein
MAAPFNYSLNVPDPTQSVMAGVQNAVGMSQAMAQRDALTAQTAEKQAALEAQKAMQADLAQISQNPTPAAIASAMVKYPQLSEGFKRTYDVLNTEQQGARVNQASQVYAAMQAGKPDIAKTLLSEQAAAARNSGNEKDAKAAETLAQLIDLHPETATTSTGLFLSAAMGPEKFTENFSKLEGERRTAALAPSTLTEAQAKASKAATEAKFAESNAVIDLQKKGWDITKIQEDIKVAKQNAGIAAMNAQINREGNLVKRQELGLKLQEMKDKRDTVIREKTAEVESARGDMDNFLNTADRVLKTPIGVVGAAAGPISSRMPTMSQETADFEELVTTLGSQAFMSQIPKMKGAGALSEKEGDKLQSSLQNLSLRQSPERLLENVREAQRLILKGRTNLAKKHGLPDTVPDTPQAAPSAGDIDALLKKYGGG